MEMFLVFQILFDAVLLFGVLFLFHFSVHQSQKKENEFDILKNVQVQEMKEQLQELLVTLKQLGKEVSDNIQEQVREAETKTETIKKIIGKLQKDIIKATTLAEEVSDEKKHLEEKAKVIHMAKKTLPKIFPTIGVSPSTSSLRPKSKNQGTFEVKDVNGLGAFKGKERGAGFSPEMLREVYHFVDSEMSLNEIVQRTKLSRAEVQLILNLRGNRFTTPN